MLVVDTDAASVLAKGELLEGTLELFEDHEVVITPKIEEELEKPLEHGYSHPNRIFDRIDTEPPAAEEREQYREWFKEQTIDKGELEAIAIADSRDAIFFTMDQAANRYAERREVQTLSFNTLAKLLNEKDILSKNRLKDSIELIEQRETTANSTSNSNKSLNYSQ